MGQAGMSKQNKKQMATKLTDPKMVAAFDSFQNFVSRVGANVGGNNALSQSEYVFNLLSKNRIGLEAMYRGSWTTGVIIDTRAEDMTRAGITITSSEAAERLTELDASFARLRIWDSFRRLKQWGDLYGGAIGLMLISGQDLESPLDVRRIGRGQFKGIKVFDRWQVTPDLFNLIESGPDQGLPMYYTLTSVYNTGLEQSQDIDELKKDFGYVDGLRIHHSRVIRQIGIELPYWQAITESLWGESVIERVYDRIVAFDNATMSAANLIDQANLTTVAVEGLRQVIGAGGAALNGLQAMFEMVAFMRSNMGITLIDAKDKSETTAYSFAGVSDLVLTLAQQLSGASKIPLIKFFAQSPTGMNSTGDADIRLYYDGINAEQESEFRPGVERVLRVLYQSTFGVPAPRDMQFTFTTLWQMSATEKATVGKSNAEALMGVFSGGGISRAMLLRELKNQSTVTGLFTSITDEDILQAEADEQFEDPPGAEGNTEEQESDTPVKDSVKRFLKKFRSKRGH